MGNKIGRPTSYKPEYCQSLVECQRQGYSATAWAGLIGVARQTIYVWAQAHPAFDDALKQGRAAAVSFWENLLQTNAQTGKGSTVACIFALKNLGREDWRDKLEVEHGMRDDLAQALDDAYKRTGTPPTIDGTAKVVN